MRHLEIMLISLVIYSPALAEDRIDAGSLIREMQSATCSHIGSEGSTTFVDVKAEAEVRIKGILENLAEAGAAVSANRKTAEYTSVLQRDLGNQLIDIRACNLAVFKLMSEDVKIWAREISDTELNGGDIFETRESCGVTIVTGNGSNTAPQTDCR